jgi:outer membrane protein assembly factor BamB
MHIRISFSLLVTLLILVLASACNKAPQFERDWVAYSFDLGTNSSPQCADLNKDGVLDVVLGNGRDEFEVCDSGIVAYDGKNGKVLWRASSQDQVVGSATFLDVTGDGTPEVFIGGRGRVLKCLQGNDGKLLWEFNPSSRTPVEACCLQYNFYNTQIIPDQDGDQLQDLLVSNGGNAKARPFMENERYPGVLAVFSSKTGNVLAVDTLPDGKETYMSPVLHDFMNDGKLFIIIGTGGETLGGNLFKVSLDSLLKNNISSSIKLATVKTRGFIGPPTLADITGDGVVDIIVNSFDGKMIAVDGKKNAILWERSFKGTESYCSVTPGYFNDDDIPDFFSTFSKGMWPENKGSIQTLINGKDGSVLYADSIGCFGYASAVSSDMNGDGIDEVIFSVNDFNCDPPKVMGISDLENDRFSLRLLDARTHKITTITQPVIGKNVSSTPWIGDLDGNGRMDLIYNMQRNHYEVDEFRGMYLVKLSSNVDMQDQPTWGAYMGNDRTGVFQRQKKKAK